MPGNGEYFYRKMDPHEVSRQAAGLALIIYLMEH
jgi:hypothetical protein